MAYKLIEKIVNSVIRLGGGLAQGQDHHSPHKVITPGMPELLRSAAAQCAVLPEKPSYSICPVQTSYENHLIAFAAEESRLTNRVVTMEDYQHRR